MQANSTKEKQMRLRTREAFTGLAFALPALIGLLTFFVVPFLVSIRMSINTANLDTTAWYVYYSDVFKSQAFTLAAMNTIKFIVVGVPLIVVTELFMAMLLFHSNTLTSFVRSAFVFPLVVPMASVILVFKAFFMDKGYINVFLSTLGHAHISWLSSGAAFYVLLLIYIWKNCGYGMVLQKYKRLLQHVPCIDKSKNHK
jgi:multiple sugar transport system permease protein